MKTQKQINLKDGLTDNGLPYLPAGLPVTFIQGNPSRCLVQGQRHEPYKVRITSAFKTPSMKSLEKWTFDSVCKSVTGKRVEPDGWSDDGSPSWLLALGMI